MKRIIQIFVLLSGVVFFIFVPYVCVFATEKTITMDADWRLSSPMDLDAGFGNVLTLDGQNKYKVYEMNATAVLKNSSGKVKLKNVEIIHAGVNAAKGSLAELQDAADSLSSIKQPKKDETKLSIPALPSGITVSIKTTSDRNIITSDGVIVLTDTQQQAGIIFTVSGNNGEVDTPNVQFIIPPKTSGTFKMPTLGGTVAISGIAKFGETVSVNTEYLTNNSGTLTYSWMRENTEVGTGKSYTIVEADIGKLLTVKVSGDGINANGSVVSATFEPAKADGPFAPLAPTAFSQTADSITLNSIVGAEYSIDGGNTWQDSNSFKGLTADKDYTFVARIKETSKYMASDKSKQDVIRTDKVKEVTSFTSKLVLPIYTVTSGMQGSVDAISVKTPIATVIVPNNILGEEQTEEASNISLTVEKADASLLSYAVKSIIENRPVLDLKLEHVGNNSKITINPEVPLTVNIPYEPKSSELADIEHIVVLSITESGNAYPVASGKYDSANGNVTFKTSEQGKYAVAYVNKEFSDISDYPWASKEIKVLASKGIIGGVTSEIFDPGANIKRADFIMMLIKALGLSAKSEDNFTDVRSYAYYSDALAIAKKLGIASGIGGNMFNPEASISRQDMMTLTVKALKVAKCDLAAGTSDVLGKYVDLVNVAPYAVESVATLVKGGIVSGEGSVINPLGNATRAETAVMMYRIYNLVK